MIEIINQTRFKIDKSDYTRLISELLAYFKLHDKYIVEVLFVNLKDIKSLNQSYRGIKSPTDVLSFSSPIIPNLIPSQVFGSIVICPTYITQKFPDFTDFKPFILHGFLHLMDYDHHNPSSKKQFYSLNKKLAHKFGIEKFY